MCMVSWLLTGAPEQRYWQNRETANIGLVSSVGREPARQSGGRRFKSRSSQFFFVHPNKNYLKYVPSQFPLWFITWYQIFRVNKEIFTRSDFEPVTLMFPSLYQLLPFCNFLLFVQKTLNLKHDLYSWCVIPQVCITFVHQPGGSM